jgi:hypothetical protein
MSADVFGRRYIKERDFIAYAKHLGLPDVFLSQKLEFAERFAIVAPAARVRFPDEIVRRWHQERHPRDVITEPIEPDGPRLDAAEMLFNTLARDLMRRTEFPRKSQHPLDRIATGHRQFISKTFSRDSFVPRDNFRTLIRKDPNSDPPGEHGGRRRFNRDFYATDGVVTYYHAWQVFPFAAFLRSGLSVLYDLECSFTSARDVDLNGDDVHTTRNIDARHELNVLRDNAALFDAVAMFQDLCDRALQVHAANNVDRTTGRLSVVASKALRRRESEIARDVFARAKLTPRVLLSFIRLQCGLWSDARSHYPPGVVDAYKRSIASTIDLLRQANPRYTGATIAKRVGATGGWHRPVLEVIFPDWVSEQRQSVEPSLRFWIVPRVSQMPAPFTFGDADVAPFCSWIERAGFLQLYWHFQRLTDIGLFDDAIGRTAASVEIVALASLVEHFATHILAERQPAPKGVLKPTLFQKVAEVLRKHDAKLATEFEQQGPLTNTKRYSLRKQLNRINRSRANAPTASVLKAMQRLVLIRNASSHAGVSGFGRDEMQRFVESLLIAALLIWKAR